MSMLGDIISASGVCSISGDIISTSGDVQYMVVFITN